VISGEIRVRKKSPIVLLGLGFVVIELQLPENMELEDTVVQLEALPENSGDSDDASCWD